MDSMRRTAKRLFDDAVNAHPSLHSELRKSLKDHPRMNVFLDNLANQMVHAQQARTAKGKPPWTGTQMRDCVNMIICTFLQTVEVEATQRIESDVARWTRDAAAQAQADMEATVAGKPQGIYEELGVRTVYDAVTTLKDGTYSTEESPTSTVPQSEFFDGEAQILPSP